MYKILYTQTYNKRAKKFFKKNPRIIEQYSKTLAILELNPNHPSLRLHKLQGNLNEIYSVSVNISIRITLYFMIQEKTIVPIDIGSHDDVYL